MKPDAKRDLGTGDLILAIGASLVLAAAPPIVIYLGAPVPHKEDCHNGIDDDWDQKVDCYDPDCRDDAQCKDLATLRNEQAVAVKPVLDVNDKVLKEGTQRPVLPDMWKPAVQRDTPSPSKTPDSVVASTHANQDKPLDDKKKHDPVSSASDPPASSAAPSSAPTTDESAGPVTSAVASADATSLPAGGPNGASSGDTTDPLKANAKKTYEARVRGFLAGLWNSHCTDDTANASGMVTVSGRTITAAGPGLEFLVGATLPAPPDNYPELTFPSQVVPFECKKTH